MKPIHLAGIAIIGLILGGLVGFALNSTNTPALPTTIANKSTHVEQVSIVPDFNYTDTQGRQRQSAEWRAKILVLNFWATWCPPCREETPMFVELQEQYQYDNVKFVGIAIDDLEPVRKFTEEYQVNYPMLMGDLQAITLSRQLGNRFEGLPFTIVAEPGGQVILRHAGGIKREQLEPVLQAAIEQSRRTHESVKRL